LTVSGFWPALSAVFVIDNQPAFPHVYAESGKWFRRVSKWFRRQRSDETNLPKTQ
jgi:hypothetical protein